MNRLDGEHKTRSVQISCPSLPFGLVQGPASTVGRRGRKTAYARRPGRHAGGKQAPHIKGASGG